jgi:hypothetical protein
MLKKFGELNVGDFFQFCRYVYVKTGDAVEKCYDGTDFKVNCVIISKCLAGNYARLLDEDTVEHLPKMRY